MNTESWTHRDNWLIAAEQFGRDMRIAVEMAREWDAVVIEYELAMLER